MVLHGTTTNPIVYLHLVFQMSLFAIFLIYGFLSEHFLDYLRIGLFLGSFCRLLWVLIIAIGWLWLVSEVDV